MYLSCHMPFQCSIKHFLVLYSCTDSRFVHITCPNYAHVACSRQFVIPFAFGGRHTCWGLVIWSFLVEYLQLKRTRIYWIGKTTHWKRSRAQKEGYWRKLCGGDQNPWLWGSVLDVFGSLKVCVLAFLFYTYKSEIAWIFRESRVEFTFFKSALRKATKHNHCGTHRPIC